MVGKKQKSITVLIIITMLHDWNEIWPRDGESVMMKRPQRKSRTFKVPKMQVNSDPCTSGPPRDTV